MNNLDSTINKLKMLSNGQKNNIPLPDDKLKEIGFKFPEDYRKVLKELSNIFYGTIDLLSVTNEKKYPSSELVIVLKEVHQQGVPLDWLPICEDNGDYYCLLKDGSIKYWSHDRITDDCWNNLVTWINDVWINGN